MSNHIRKSIQFGAHTLTLETGEIARQAGGAVMASLGDSVAPRVTCVAAKSAKPGQDFFPLTVDYQERTYAAGKIPGGFFRREGRPSEKEILTCRLIDRPVFQMDNIHSYTTLTGLTLAQVAEKLDAELPKDAYTAVPGAAGLTDIDPNYMRKVLNETFGMCGIGWGYSYEPGDLVVAVEERKIKAGGVRRVHVASLKRLRLWYKLNGPAAIHICDVYSSGGSDNDFEGYAISGAITNAIGKAVSNLGFQESVYLGKRSHTTVGKKAAPKAEAKKPAASKAVGFFALCDLVLTRFHLAGRAH